MKIGDLRKNQLEVLFSLSWILSSVAQVVLILVIITITINKQNTKMQNAKYKKTKYKIQNTEQEIKECKPTALPDLPNAFVTNLQYNVGSKLVFYCHLIFAQS